MQVSPAAAAGELIVRRLWLLAMHAYKNQLWHGLVDQGWEIVEVVASDEWWADEFWKVQSLRNRWGLEIILAFLVNPLWDAPRKKGQGVWSISASEGFPGDRLGAEKGIADLCMAKGRFDEKLAAFLAALDAYRNSQQVHGGEAAEPHYDL